jgi:hypothetical protein
MLFHKMAIYCTYFKDLISVYTVKLLEPVGISNTLLAGRKGNWVTFPTGAKEFSLEHEEWSWDPHSLISDGYRRLISCG